MKDLGNFKIRSFGIGFWIWWGQLQCIPSFTKFMATPPTVLMMCLRGSFKGDDDQQTIIFFSFKRIQDFNLMSGIHMHKSDLYFDLRTAATQIFK